MEELRNKLMGIIAPVKRNENSSLGSSTPEEAVDKVLALIATHEKQLLEISSAEASYIVGCIDFDLAEFSDTYSNSQMKFINDLRAKMRAHKESLTKSIERGE